MEKLIKLLFCCVLLLFITVIFQGFYIYDLSNDIEDARLEGRVNSDDINILSRDFDRLKNDLSAIRDKVEDHERTLDKIR